MSRKRLRKPPARREPPRAPPDEIHVVADEPEEVKAAKARAETATGSVFGEPVATMQRRIFGE